MMEFCRRFYVILVVSCVPTTIATFHRDVLIPRVWFSDFGQYDNSEIPFYRRKPSGRSNIPAVKDLLRSLERNTALDFQDYPIVDMNFNVTDIRRPQGKFFLPNQRIVYVMMNNGFDRGKFVANESNGTFTLEDSGASRSSRKEAFKSSFGITRLSPFTQNTTAACRKYPGGITVETCRPTLVDSNHAVECEWTLGIHEGLTGKAYATIEFKITYEILNGSNCVREKRYTASVVHVDMVDYVSRSVKTQVTVFANELALLQAFPRIDIDAFLNGSTPDGTVNCISNCTERSVVQLFNEPGVLKKVMKMIHMGMSLVLDGKISDNTYTPNQERKYEDFLLYWDHLSSLDLSNLSLKSFNNNYLMKVHDLQSLSFANTGISEIPQGLLDLHTLRTLNLAGNVDLLQDNLAKILKPLQQLQNLDLSDLPLKNLNNIQELLHSIKLQGLYLRNCSLTTVNMNLFRELHELVNLDLSKNPLGSVPRDLVSNMPKLESLGLSSINLQSGPGISLGKVRLQKLDLSNNSLVTVDNIISSGFINDLDLKGNQIKEWYTEDIFTQNGLQWVDKINFVNNQLTAVTDAMGNSFESLEEIKLEGNPFDCTYCSTFQVTRKWLHSDRKYLQLTNYGWHSYLYCSTPKELSEYPITLVSPARICSGLSWHLLWLLLIPIVVLGGFIVVYMVFQRRFQFQLKHMQYMEQVKKKNRRRAATLHEKHFEYDVYLVYSPKDSNFANYLKIRLEKSHYRVLVSRRDFDAVSDEVRMSRHVVVVVTNNLTKCEWAQRGVERTNFWLLSGEFHNIILLLMEGVNKYALSPPMKLLQSQHDHINWRTSLGVDEVHFQTLLSYMGPSNFATWQNALRQQLEQEQPLSPSTSSKFLPQVVHNFFSKTRRNQKRDAEPQISSLL